MYHLLAHFKGLESFNHRLLSPDGQPTMSEADVREHLMSTLEHAAIQPNIPDSWTQYISINYSVIVMAIKALWGRDLDTFMSETLFTPLGMNSTSIGVSADRDTEIEG